MADCYSSMAAKEWVSCSRADFDLFDNELQEERWRLEEEDLDFNIQAEFSEEDGVLIFAEDYFCEDDLTENVCMAIGRFLRSVGQDFLEFGFSQTASEMTDWAHGGGSFRVYSDGRLCWPELVWERR